MAVVPGLIYIQNVFSLIFLDTNYLEVVNNICVNSCVTNKNAQRHGTGILSKLDKVPRPWTTHRISHEKMRIKI